MAEDPANSRWPDGSSTRLHTYDTAIRVRAEMMNDNVQEYSIPVSISVRAVPVPSLCTVELSAGDPVGKIVGTGLKLRFVARDIDGLPINHGDEPFAAFLYKNGEVDRLVGALNVAYSGAGAYDVSVTITGRVQGYSFYVRVPCPSHAHMPMPTPFPCLPMPQAAYMQQCPCRCAAHILMSVGTHGSAPLAGARGALRRQHH